MTDDLKALRAAADAATPGPWTSQPVILAGSDGNTSWGESTGRILCGPPQTIERKTLSARWFSRKEDAEFIALANPATILKLLDDLDRAEVGKQDSGRDAALELRNVDEVMRHSDQSVRIRFKSARSASQFERAIRDAALAAQQREGEKS